MGQASSGVRAAALVGTSPQIRALSAALERVAESEAPVLVTGEPGTGKSQIAELVHAASRRSAGPFVSFNLSATKPDSFEAELFGRRLGALSDPDQPGALARAHGGTLFLEDLESVHERVQSGLLRAIERQEITALGAQHGRQYDVRVVAAANHDLTEDVRTGRIRPELYHRLAVMCVELPPLRERREDIPLIVESTLEELAQACGRPPVAVTSESMDALCRCDWPGNIRELRGVLERAVLRSPDSSALDVSMLHLDSSQKRSGVLLTRSWQPFKEAKNQLLEEWETEYLRVVLERARGNIALAARYAGLARGHVYRLLKKHNL